MKQQLILFAFLLTGITIIGYSQSAIVPIGGDAQGNSGSVSYTVGQSEKLAVKS